MSHLLILGAGGHAKVVAETAFAVGCFSSIAFLDDRSSSSLLDWPVLGRLICLIHPYKQDSLRPGCCWFCRFVSIC